MNETGGPLEKLHREVAGGSAYHLARAKKVRNEQKDETPIGKCGEALSEPFVPLKRESNTERKEKGTKAKKHSIKKISLEPVDLDALDKETTEVNVKIVCSMALEC